MVEIWSGILVEWLLLQPRILKSSKLGLKTRTLALLYSCDYIIPGLMSVYWFSRMRAEVKTQRWSQGSAAPCWWNPKSLDLRLWLHHERDLYSLKHAWCGVCLCKSFLSLYIFQKALCVCVRARACARACVCIPYLIIFNFTPQSNFSFEFIA